MRRVHIDHVVPGVKLAKTVFNNDGRVLLTSGMEMKDIFIERLRNNNISEMYIEDEVSENIQVDEVVCEETRSDAIKIVKKLMHDRMFSNTLNIGKVREFVDKIIDELISNEDILVNLASIKSVDDYTFEHSVNVCVLSLLMGIGLGFNRLRLKDLGMGAILHDIGKIKIPEEILKKPSQLTVEEFEEIKKHTVYGYEILKECKKISSISAFVAFAHHERYDGSGYPLQLRGENIHLCARIVAVADVYDALTSDRVYRKKLQPHEVVEYLASLGSHHFDIEIVKSFIKFIAVYPIGTGVVLNTKEKALVVKSNKNKPMRPVVRVIYDGDDRKLPEFNEIDLSEKMNVFITGTCDF